MEGLIPMVYKSLKKNKTRRKYECLSSGAASHTYNIADFDIKDDHRDYFSKKQEYVTPGPDKVSGLRGAHHRRYNSVHVVGRGRGFALEEDAAAAKPKQLVRFRSHRMLSCITGA